MTIYTTGLAEPSSIIEKLYTQLILNIEMEEPLQYQDIHKETPMISFIPKLEELTTKSFMAGSYEVEIPFDLEYRYFINQKDALQMNQWALDFTNLIEAESKGGFPHLSIEGIEAKQLKQIQPFTIHKQTEEIATLVASYTFRYKKKGRYV